ncbi:unnamed protein product [Caenorhabditis angaria]|uniref:Uncharacterized protein n=1 Tax=Caenorhabditis angaria TaxID=860376 RepID=A0A9P1MXW3_9PELO|nr:unnamed protein product [Caenorhabditis angaria]
MSKLPIFLVFQSGRGGFENATWQFIAGLSYCTFIEWHVFAKCFGDCDFGESIYVDFFDAKSGRDPNVIVHLFAN